MGGVLLMDVLGESFKINIEAAHDMMAAYLPLMKKWSQKKFLNMLVLLWTTISDRVRGDRS
jgi:hypothetical protein